MRHGQDVPDKTARLFISSRVCGDIVQGIKCCSVFIVSGDAGCCGGHWTKVSRLSKAYRCNGTAGMTLPSAAPTRLANKSAQPYPASSAVADQGSAQHSVNLHRSARHSQPTSDLHNNTDHGVCMAATRIDSPMGVASVNGSPLSFPWRKSISLRDRHAHAKVQLHNGATRCAQAKAVKTASMVERLSMSGPIGGWMNGVNVDVISKLNWHFGFHSVVLRRVVSFGVPFLFFVGKAGSESL
jgi:hypothetical protein